MRSALFLVLFTSLCGLAACGGDAADTTPAPAASTRPTGKRVDAATAGSVSGRVQFDGAVPPAEMIRLSTDRNCVANGQPARPSDALLVDDGKGVGNAFVYFKHEEQGLGPEFARKFIAALG